jgi:hypothetical protein
LGSCHLDAGRVLPYDGADEPGVMENNAG